MMSSDDVSSVLNLVADLFAASPCHTFTREDVIRVLRSIPEEISREMLNMELERAMAVQSGVKPS